jgi:hypothetical protein
MNIQNTRLTTEAVNEYRAIYQEEFNELLDYDEAEIKAMELLRFFDILVSEPVEKDPGVEVTQHEHLAMKHIHICLFHHHRQPTIRSITEAIGKRSSRSGFRVLTSLMKKTLAWKDEKGNITMVAGHCEVWGCGAGKRD